MRRSTFIVMIIFLIGGLRILSSLLLKIEIPKRYLESLRSIKEYGIFIANMSSHQTKYSLDSFHQSDEEVSTNYSVRIMQKIRAFSPVISVAERFIIYDLLKLFDETMTKNNMTYFLSAGSLMGSYRHHDIIPWDDDIDVIMPLKERSKMRKIFQSFSPRYKLAETSEHDKLYRYDSVKATKYDWKWPYVDISFYDENSTFLWDIASPYGFKIYHPKSIVFPLHRRPLYNLYLNAPKDSFAALVWTFGFTDKCHEIEYSHILEAGVTSKVAGEKIKCSLLSERYPFVRRSSHENGILEELVYKGERITSYVVNEPRYAMCKMFEINLAEGYEIPRSVQYP